MLLSIMVILWRKILQRYTTRYTTLHQLKTEPTVHQKFDVKVSVESNTICSEEKKNHGCVELIKV